MAKNDISAATRERWRKERDFVMRFGNRYLNERERTLVVEVDRTLSRGGDLVFADSIALSRLYAQMQERIG